MGNCCFTDNKLIIACKEGNINFVRKNSSDANRIIYKNAFSTAVSNDYDCIIDWLLQNDKNGYLNTIFLHQQFMFACDKDYINSARKIYHHISFDITSMLIKKMCIKGNLNILKWFLSMNPFEDDFFKEAIVNGNLEVIKYLHTFVKPKKFHLMLMEKFCFLEVCRKGYLEVAQWLVSVYPLIDIEVSDHYAFRTAASMGHLEIIMWLFTLYKEVPIEILDKSFKEASINNQINVVTWFNKLNPRYSFRIFQDVIVEDKIHKHVYGKEECAICFDESNSITTCGHQFCELCILDWLTYNNDCPICRIEIDSYYSA